MAGAQPIVTAAARSPSDGSAESTAIANATGTPIRIVTAMKRSWIRALAPIERTAIPPANNSVRHTTYPTIGPATSVIRAASGRPITHKAAAQMTAVMTGGIQPRNRTARTAPASSNGFVGFSSRAASVG